MAQAIVNDLRTASYKAAGTLQRSLDPSERMSRDDFSKLLDAMSRAGLIQIEDAEYEKDGDVRRYRRVRLTDAGSGSDLIGADELLIADGIADLHGGGPAEKEQAIRPSKGERD